MTSTSQRWKAAEEGPASKYLALIKDREEAVDWLRSPNLVEPANLILVDPLQAAGLEREPVYYVNGPWRTRAQAVEEANQLARQMKQPVWLLYNATIDDPEHVNREDYLRLLSHLLFFGLPVPENLVDATLEGADLVNVEGLDKKKLADVAEAQWDSRWYDWMSQAPTVELAGRKEQVFPHQHNAATRQLASVLLEADGPLTVVTHSQGGLIFRNASLIASQLSDTEWSKRRITWRWIALPLAEKPQKVPLPGMVQMQLMYCANRSDGGLAFWQRPVCSFQSALAGTPPFATVFSNMAVPDLPQQYGRLLEVSNDSTQKIRIYVQYMGWRNNSWIVEPAGPSSEWRMKELGPGEVWIDSTFVASAIRYWVDYEFGWRDQTHRTNSPIWLVDSPSFSYVGDFPATYFLSVPQPKGSQTFNAVLVEATVQAVNGVKVQMDGSWNDPILGSKPMNSEVTHLPVKQPPWLLRDSQNWPIRAATLTANVMQEDITFPSIFYSFPTTSGGSMSLPINPNTAGISTFTVPGTPYSSNTGEMDRLRIDFK